MSSIVSPPSQWVRLLIGMALTVALLTWALRGMSPSSVWTALQTAQLGWLGLSAVCLLASCSVRARRWGTLLEAQCNPGSFDIRQSAVFIGCAGNCLLPAHAGELVRGAVLQRRGGVSLGLGLGSIFVERILDVIVVLTFMLVSSLPGPGNKVGSSGLDGVQLGWIGVALLAVCGGIFAAVSLSQQIVGLAEKICLGVGLGRFTSPVVETVRALLTGLAVLRSPQRTFLALVETLLIVGLSVLTFWTAMLAFGITGPGFTGALVTQSITTLGMAIPSAPGYVGTFEAAIRLSLELYDVPTDAIIAYSLTLHALVLVSLISVGGVMAMRMGFSFSDFSSSSFSRVDRPAEHKAVV